MASLKLYKRGKRWWVAGTVNRKLVRESTGHTSQERARQWAAKRGWELEQEAVFGAESVFTFGAALNMYIEGGGEQRFLMPLLDEWERKLMKDIAPGAAYCKTHDPERVKARQAEANAKATAKWNAERYRWHGKTFYYALEQIANGHNDARELAQKVIADFKAGEQS